MDPHPSEMRIGSRREHAHRFEVSKGGKPIVALVVYTSTLEATIQMSERNVLANQKQILKNQKAILANQGQIKANQETIKKNQGAILKNQKQILAAVKK